MDTAELAQGRVACFALEVRARDAETKVVTLSFEKKELEGQLAHARVKEQEAVRKLAAEQGVGGELKSRCELLEQKLARSEQAEVGADEEGTRVVSGEGAWQEGASEHYTIIKGALMKVNEELKDVVGGVTLALQQVLARIDGL